MVGITGYKVYIANFFDSNGNFITSKVIGRSFTALKIKFFSYNAQIYNYIPSASRSYITPFPKLMDYYFYSYQLGNPDPLQQFDPNRALFSASNYNSILKSDILSKLNNVRNKGLAALLDPKILIPILIGGAIGVYFLTGGQIT